MRAWAEKNGFTFSDVINAIIVPAAYYLENYCSIDTTKSKATVIMNIGELDIFHVHKGRCYPLATSIDRPQESIQLEQIETRLKHWIERNKKNSEHYDVQLTKSGTDGKAKNSRKKRT